MKKLGLLFCVMLVALFSFGSEVEVPKFTHQYVNDYGELLSQSEEQSINRMLRTYQDSTSNQLMVLTLASNDYENEGTLFDFSQKVFVTWGIGQKGKNNGVLLVLVKNPNPNKTPHARIVTGYGIEGSLPDIACKRIIRSSRPLINEGNYYQGINLILGEIIIKIDKEFVADKTKREDFPTWAFFFIGFLVIAIIALIYFVSNSLRKDEDSTDFGGGSGTNDNSKRSRRSRDNDDDDYNRNIFIGSTFVSSDDSYSGNDVGDVGCECGGGESGGAGAGD